MEGRENKKKVIQKTGYVIASSNGKWKKEEIEGTAYIKSSL